MREIKTVYDLWDALWDCDTHDVPYIGSVGGEMALKIAHPEEDSCYVYFVLPVGD
jgi:hypothetical protein